MEHHSEEEDFEEDYTTPPAHSSQRPLPPRPAPPRAGGPPPPAPPAAGLVRPEESALMDYMRQRMESMERELGKERERALSSEQLLKQQEVLRGEVESQLKKISEQIKQEKMVGQLQEDRSAFAGRVQSLEKRLNEMHNIWAELLREAVGKRETEVSFAAPEVEALNTGVGKLRKDLALFKDELSALPGLVPELQQLGKILPAESRRRAEEEKALREHISALIARMSETLTERMSSLDHRLASELEAHQERMTRMTHERDALRETIDEQRALIRQETLKERTELETRINDRIEKLTAAVEKLDERHGDTDASLDAIEELSKKLYTHATRPEKAKDQIILDLEAEKRELMKALKHRTEELRGYTVERREVEHSLGESLMEMQRQIESERGKDRQSRDRMSELENQVESLKAEAALRNKESEQKDERFRTLGAERDQIILAFTEEAEKVKKQINERMASDKAWESRILEFQKSLDEERDKRLQAETAVKDLRAQMQT
ncbi:MAG: hypothetical protein V3S11_01875, partial [Elusimicrobiota bacterium]